MLLDAIIYTIVMLVAIAGLSGWIWFAASVMHTTIYTLKFRIRFGHFPKKDIITSLEYYIEANEVLTQKVIDQEQIIKSLREDIIQYHKDINTELRKDLTHVTSQGDKALEALIAAQKG